MASLKNMIRSWLDDTYPEMPVSQRESLANTMDVSLIERKKEDSIKHIYEINSVVRMSLIEMQFIKKVSDLLPFLYSFCYLSQSVLTSQFAYCNFSFVYEGANERHVCYGRTYVLE
jgi:hypothetical protein